mgnify:CR=1 FL=1
MGSSKYCHFKPTIKEDHYFNGDNNTKSIILTNVRIHLKKLFLVQ